MASAGEDTASSIEQPATAEGQGSPSNTSSAKVESRVQSEDEPQFRPTDSNVSGKNLLANIEIRVQSEDEYKFRPLDSKVTGKFSFDELAIKILFTDGCIKLVFSFSQNL